jgi:hypothetical protein
MSQEGFLGNPVQLVDALTRNAEPAANLVA